MHKCTYDAEIHDDMTKVWECEECIDESADEI